MIIEAVNGHTVTSLDDDYVITKEQAMEANNATSPAGGGLAVNFPFRKDVELVEGKGGRPTHI